MSTSEHSKCVTVNDSYIPISKRNYSGLKKSKGCAQLPELQKYIETIIKARGEHDADDTSASEKEKFPKEIKFGKRAVCKGLDNRIKCEKVKFDLSRRKTKTKPKTSLSEAVSSGVEISNKFMFEFEDPRNWNFDRNQNLGPCLRIETFLKKLYPNPYNLSSINNLRKSKTNLIFEKVGKDDLRDGTSSDVVISKVDAQTEVDFESPDNVIENAEFEKKSNERENHTDDINLVPALEKCNPSPTHADYNPDFEVPTLNTVTDLSQKSFKNERSNSTSNLSSRMNSLESINEVLCKKDHINFEKRKNFKIKNTIVPGEKLPVVESKPLKADMQGHDKHLNDYDIGKLKLLSMSDSDDSIASKKFPFEQTQMENTKNNVTDDFITFTNSEISDEFNKTDELCDLLQIYSVMNKATESFLLLNSKKEFMNSELEVLPSNIEDEIFSEFFNEPNTVTEALCSEKNEKEEIKCPENCTENKEIERSNSMTECQIENESVRNDEGKNGKKFSDDLLNIALKEEMELKNNLKEMSSARTKASSKLENEISFPINETDFADSENPDNVEENEEQKFKENLDTNQKIDEVLQFMYDCLKKFNNQEKLSQENEKYFPQENKKINKNTSKKLLKERMADAKLEKHSSSQFKKKSFIPVTEKKSTESLSAISLLDVKEIKSKYTAALDELNKKQNPRMESKKRIRMDTIVSCLPHAEKKIKRLPSPHQTLNSDTEMVSTTDLDLCDVRWDSFEGNNETCVQTVESQNELGGYTEETSPSSIVPNTDLPIVKSMFPFSIKAKKSKTETFKTLKNVLEIEEKLFADEFREEESQPAKKASEKHKEIVKPKSSRALTKKKTRNGYPFEGDLKRPNSNFVICLNSFPRNLRTVTIRPNVPLVPPDTVSVSDVRSCDIKPLMYYPKHSSQRFSVLFDKEKQTALQCFYRFKEGALKTVNKTAVAYTARPIRLKFTVHLCELHKDFPLKNSECQGKVRMMKKSFFMGSSNPDTSKCNSKNALIFKPSITNLISSENRLNIISQEEKPVEALAEVLKEAEEKVILLEKTSDSAENLCRSSESLYNCSVQHSKSKMLRNASKNQIERKKVLDLLLRTYNLQQRLHQYLHKITVQPCPLVQQEPFLDFGLFLSNKTESNISLTEFEINQEQTLPYVHWCLQPPKSIKKSKTEETLVVNVQTVDCGTSYNPPSVGSETNLEKSDKPSCQAVHSSSNEKEEEMCKKLENDEDDKSSTYSFKSSNDFSEAKENPNQKKENSDIAERGDLIKQLFNKIELFRQSFKEEKLKNQDKKCTKLANVDSSSCNKIEEQKENGLVEYDPKTTAKVLKTVFRGKKSSTELTIGLKDVPMTKVNNISVEKKKFSPNHTKISICISKEKSEELRQSNKKDNDVLHNGFSSYYFDHIKPSLSTCQTEYSKLNDSISKSTQSLNEENDEDEIYKSAESTAGDSDTDEILEEKSKSEEKEIFPPLPQKNLTRYKFDFYRKMDLKKDEDKEKETSLTSSWSRYKELEPLKRALTEMQIRMRSIKRDAFLNSSDYYERALKLAKMSAGFCQSCGTRAVIPDDTFGFYKTLLPRRCSHPRRCRPIRTTLTPNPSFYSFRTGNAEVDGQFCDLNIKHSSSYMLNRATHLRSSVQDMPILLERI